MTEDQISKSCRESKFMLSIDEEIDAAVLPYLHLSYDDDDDDDDRKMPSQQNVINTIQDSLTARGSSSDPYPSYQDQHYNKHQISNETSAPASCKAGLINRPNVIYPTYGSLTPSVAPNYPQQLMNDCFPSGGSHDVARMPPTSSFYPQNNYWQPSSSNIGYHHMSASISSYYPREISTTHIYGESAGSSRPSSYWDMAIPSQHQYTSALESTSTSNAIISLPSSSRTSYHSSKTMLRPKSLKSPPKSVIALNYSSAQPPPLYIDQQKTPLVDNKRKFKSISSIDPKKNVPSLQSSALPATEVDRIKSFQRNTILVLAERLFTPKELQEMHFEADRLTSYYAARAIDCKVSDNSRYVGQREPQREQRHHKG